MSEELPKKSKRGGKREGAGRPKLVQNKNLKALISESVDFQGVLKSILHIINNPKSKDSDRLKASQLLLEYNFGKPHQSVAIDATIKGGLSPEKIASFYELAEEIESEDI